MTWATRRRILIVLIVLVVVGLGVFYKTSPLIFKTPMCTDGTQNGTETGIDCGGGCAALCSFEVKKPAVLWTRSFPVTDSVYNAVAYIENKNDAAVKALPYEFRLYDAKGIFIARITGVAEIPPLGRYAIVETGINVGAASVSRTTFEFADAPTQWVHIPASIEKLIVTTADMAFDTSGTVPRLSAKVTNPSATIELQDTVVAAILYDADNNAVNVSRTVIPVLAPQKSTQVVFTWPRTLSGSVVRYELLPIIDVFNAK